MTHKHLKPYFPSVFLTLFILMSCSFKKNNIPDDDLFKNPVTIKDSVFVDGFGRQILFNGINLVNKNKSDNYIYNNSEHIFRKFRKWGYNVVRLGIIWDGLEPEPGRYNEKYLKEIDKQIELAGENGIYVFLDMHQDLYSVKFSDGAPQWATLDENKPHIKGEIWSDAYLISPAVQTSWDNFWNNTPAPDGTGLQDHYAKMWQYIAKRYAGNNTVLGYDIMNEPFVGSEARNYMPILFNAFSQLMKEQTGKSVSLDEIASMWSNQKSRYTALQMISSKKRFKKVIDALYVINSAFEKDKLQPFYQKVTDAIRTVDKQKIIFFNHSYFCNSGVITALEPVKTADGTKDPLTAYAAHVYDLLVDTKNFGNSSNERLELIFERIYESGKRMNVPVLIGEWGALNSDVPEMKTLAYNNINLINRFLFSNTYWAYYNNIEKNSWFSALIRPYPAFIAGRLISYSYDENTGNFECKWKESKKQEKPTRIYIPEIEKINTDNLTLTPQGNGVVLESLEDGPGGYISVYPTGHDCVRIISLTIDLNMQETISLTQK
ncbi:MAG: glycoside hydrolase family 5 protein [Chlorobi bacterium]|nr:glycoside hydrolase family 5 protein [Chlorobiota bacterium]